MLRCLTSCLGRRPEPEMLQKKKRPTAGQKQRRPDQHTRPSDKSAGLSSLTAPQKKQHPATDQGDRGTPGPSPKPRGSQQEEGGGSTGGGISSQKTLPSAGLLPSRARAQTANPLPDSADAETAGAKPSKMSRAATVARAASPLRFFPGISKRVRSDTAGESQRSNGSVAGSIAGSVAGSVAVGVGRAGKRTRFPGMTGRRTDGKIGAEGRDGSPSKEMSPNRRSPNRKRGFGFPGFSTRSYYQPVEPDIPPTEEELAIKAEKAVAARRARELAAERAAARSAARGWRDPLAVRPTYEDMAQGDAAHPQIRWDHRDRLLWDRPAYIEDKVANGASERHYPSVGHFYMDARAPQTKSFLF